MSERPRFPSQPDELLRRLGSQVVPVEEPARVEQRREQVVAALSRSIRETVERKRSATRKRWIWAVGLAASLALGIGIAARARHTHDTATTVADVRGAVVVTEGGESRVLSHGGKLALRAQGEIETALEAQAEIRSQKSLVHIGPATKLTVPQATNLEERYRLALGRVDVSVDKDSRVTRSVVVETPHAEVVVHGTVFAVGVSSRSDHLVTEVSVSRGSVWVLANGVQVALLGPGQRWSSDALSASSTPTAVSDARAVPEIAPLEAVPPREVVRAPHREQTSAEIKASTLAEQSHMFQDAIDARNRGDDARAVELFTRLLSRYPSYEEAEVQLFRAEKRLGRASAASAEARRYLAQHPQGFAHEEARALALSPAGAASH
ncbi:MAG: FecR family protein [Myxococcales bacterium]